MFEKGKELGGKKNEIFSIFKAGRHNMFLDVIKHTQDNEYANKLIIGCHSHPTSCIK
jgi:glucose-6-phosphate 1-dehydrogenase